MKPAADGEAPARGACPVCIRRSWLLGDLSALLDYHRGDPARLGALLDLDDAELIDALGGRRRETLRDAWGEFSPGDLERLSDGGEICPHDGRWTGRLLDVPRTPMMWLSSHPARLDRLLDAPRVAILGPRAASSYGVAVAGSLARELAVAGVTVIGPLTGELSAATHLAAEAAGAGSIGIAGDGLRRICPSSAQRGARLVGRRGCVASSLPARYSGRGWGALAALWTIVGLADLVIVVEVGEGPAGSEAGRSALALGRPLGAVPGPVTSRRSAGSHALIRDGAVLVEGAADALEVLHGAGAPGRSDAGRRPSLPPELWAILDRVGAGEDTAERLLVGQGDARLVIAALGELEAMGLLARLPGGRYVNTGPPLPQPRGA